MATKTEVKFVRLSVNDTDEQITLCLQGWYDAGWRVVGTAGREDNFIIILERLKP